MRQRTALRLSWQFIQLPGTIDGVSYNPAKVIAHGPGVIAVGIVRAATGR